MRTCPFLKERIEIRCFGIDRPDAGFVKPVVSVSYKCLGLYNPVSSEIVCKRLSRPLLENGTEKSHFVINASKQAHNQVNRAGDGQRCHENGAYQQARHYYN